MSEQLEKETTKQIVEPPKMWNVIMYNDDFTTVEFVMGCLMYIFSKSESEAAIITKAIHNTGKGIVGQYTKDIAQTKKDMAELFARQEQHPLKVEVEIA